MEQFGFLRASKHSRSASTGLPGASRSTRRTERTSSRRSSGKQDGFTLLETLTALGILALAFASLFGTFSTGLRAVRTADSYVEALNLAQSLLEEQTQSWTQKVGTSRGTHRELAWAVAVERAGISGIPSPKNGRWNLYRVKVRVTWKPNREINLETLKLGERSDRANQDST